MLLNSVWPSSPRAMISSTTDTLLLLLQRVRKSDTTTAFSERFFRQVAIPFCFFSNSSVSLCFSFTREMNSELTYSLTERWPVMNSKWMVRPWPFSSISCFKAVCSSAVKFPMAVSRKSFFSSVSSFAEKKLFRAERIDEAFRKMKSKRAGALSISSFRPVVFFCCAFESSGSFSMSVANASSNNTMVPVFASLYVFSKVKVERPLPGWCISCETAMRNSRALEWHTGLPFAVSRGWPFSYNAKSFSRITISRLFSIVQFGLMRER